MKAKLKKILIMVVLFPWAVFFGVIYAIAKALEPLLHALGICTGV